MKVTATFSNGHTISRNTTRAYTHAYIVKNQWNTFTGFSANEKSAMAAAKSYCKYGTVELCEVVQVTSGE